MADSTRYACNHCHRGSEACKLARGEPRLPSRLLRRPSAVSLSPTKAAQNKRERRRGTTLGRYCRMDNSRSSDDCTSSVHISCAHRLQAAQGALEGFSSRDLERLRRRARSARASRCPGGGRRKARGRALACSAEHTLAQRSPSRCGRSTTSIFCVPDVASWTCCGFQPGSPKHWRCRCCSDARRKLPNLAGGGSLRGR